MKFPQIKDKKCLLCEGDLSIATVFDSSDFFGSCDNCFIKYYSSCITIYSRDVIELDWSHFDYAIDYNGWVGGPNYSRWFNIEECQTFKEVVHKANKIMIFE